MRDRLDLVVPLEPVAPASFGATSPEPTEVVARRVAQAGQAQHARQGVPNVEMPAAEFGPRTGFERPVLDHLALRGRQLSLSLRRIHRAARVARTIADLDGAGAVRADHIDEAIQHRPKEAWT
jgi:magnesium chelatase family protein